MLRRVLKTKSKLVSDSQGLVHNGEGGFRLITRGTKLGPLLLHTHPLQLPLALYLRMISDGQELIHLLSDTTTLADIIMYS